MNEKQTDTDLIIVILNWNSPEDTKECIESLLPQIQESQKIIIVDNGSSDNSVEILNKTFPEIEILRNSRNLGFQGGMNVGIRRAMELSTEFIMILNNDIVADSKMIQTLIDLFPEDAALVSPILFYHSEPDRVWSIGGKISSVLLEVPRASKSIHIPDGIIEQDFLPSCAWLVKKEVFKEIGLLDENFFPIYYDDLDFCLRARKKGYKLYLIPEAKLWHKISMSLGGQYSPKERYLMARNSGYYFRKHMRLWQIPIIIPYRIGSAILWALRLLRSNNVKAMQAHLKGFLNGWFSTLPSNKPNHTK